MSSRNAAVEGAILSGMLEVRQLVAVDEAIFAKVDIPRGTRIAAEVPLIMLPPTPSFEKEVLEFCKTVDGITNDEFKEIEQLPSSSKAADEMRERGFVANEVWNFYKSKKLKNNDGTLLKGKKLRKIVNKTVNICIIYLINNVELGPHGKYGSGLCSLYARIGHSCVPNAYNSWNPTLQRLTLHAIRDIKAGQQILVDYIGNACRTRMQRGVSLYAAWRIVCNCAACTDDAIDQLRYRMLLLDQALAAYEHGVSHETHITGVPKLETTQQALNAAEELVKLLKKQRLCGPSVLRNMENNKDNRLRECSRFAFDSKAYEKALKYAREELKYETLLIGTETDHLKEGYYGAKYWVEYVEKEVKARVFR